MDEITTIGFDIAKNVFQLHGVDAHGQIVPRKSLRRGQLHQFFEKLPPCLIGMEACATAHHWARTLMTSGHDVRLIPPAYIKPYLRRQKNDAADAAAICEAVTRPSMRFSKRLATIPGIGTVTASCLSASVPDARVFKCGREFAAWMGLVP
ncbi:transposase, partial [Phyllobacterium zundukense]